jgi:hypothetical protein
MVVLPVPPLPARAIVYGIFSAFLSNSEGSKVQGSAQPPAKKTAGQIEKETPARQMSNVD